MSEETRNTRKGGSEGGEAVEMKGNTSFPPSYRRIFAFVKRGHIVYLVTFLCRSPLPPRRKLHVCGPLHITMTTTRCEWVRQIEIEGPFANVDCTHSLLILPPPPLQSRANSTPSLLARTGEERSTPEFHGVAATGYGPCRRRKTVARGVCLPRRQMTNEGLIR